MSNSVFGLRTRSGSILDIIEGIPVGDLLLDIYPGASAAYSLRKLRDLYSGSAVRIRRESDNNEIDIGFAGTSLDTSTLVAFCTGTNGLVTIWYDQSGNSENLTRPTAINQPKIYDAVSGLVTTGGSPSIFFDGVNDYLYRDFLLTRGQPVYFEIVATQPNNNSGFIFDSSDPNRIALLKDGMGNNAYAYAGSDFKTTTNTFLGGNRYLYTLLFNSTNSEIYQNSVLRRTGNPGPNGISDLFLGTRFTLQFFADTFIQEFIIYPSNQSSNRTDIETNINTHYNIY